MKTVLIVDDEVDIARTLGLFIELSGYRVEVAFDGHEALRKVVEDRPDLIITDITMPRMDGRELIERVRSLEGRRDIPIITISAREAAGVSGAQRSLRKPFTPAELVEEIGHLLDDES